MKKVLLALVLLSGILFAKQLTQAEQKELIQTLKTQLQGTDKSQALPLGLLYEDGIINSENKKVPDMDEATKYFVMAYENKDYRSVFKLSIMLIEKKEYKEALKILQTAISKSKSRSLIMGAVTTYGNLAMDYFPNDKDVLMDAVFNFDAVTKKEIDNVPTSKFTKALLLGAIGNTQQGEVLLNEACFSKKAPEGLKRHCFNPDNFQISKNDVEKSIDDCTTCNLLKN